MPRPESLDQTILKLRERNEFLERANQKLGEDRRRILDQFEEIERMLGGLGGLTLAGAVAARLAKQVRIETKRERFKAESRATRSVNLEALGYSRDTGAISDDIFLDDLIG